MRFTSEEQQGDIDLCKDCYLKGKLFVEKTTDDSVVVEVDGRPINGLTCKGFNDLKPIPIERFEVASTSAISPENENIDTQRPLQSSLERASGFEMLLSHLFDFLLPLVVRDGFSVPLLRLLLDLVKSMDLNSLSQIVREVTRGMSLLLEKAAESQENLSNAVAINLAEAVRALVSLLTTFDDHSQAHNTGTKLCAVHGLPVAKRK